MSEIVKKNNATLPAEWKINSSGLDAVQLMTDSLKTTGRHGIIATIPIVCQGLKCPYAPTCPIINMGVDILTIEGQRCPVEISKILNKFDDYVSHFNLDLATVDIVVIGLIKELIDYDIQIERADNIMAQRGHFLEDVVVGISSDGRPIVNKEVSKPVDYKERSIKKKHEILQLLNSTPKDRAGININIMDPSTYAADLMAKAKLMQDEGIISADFEVLEE